MNVPTSETMPKKHLLEFPADADLIPVYGQPFIRKGKNAFAINSEFFAAQYLKTHDLSYYDAMEDNGWVLWTGVRWEPIEKKAILDQLENTLLEAMSGNDIALQNEVDFSVPRIYQLIERKRNCGRIPSLDPDILPLQNGILQWDEKAQDFLFRDYTREDLIFTTMNAEFKGNAQSEYFEKILNAILQNPEDQRLAQEYLGACLFPENRTRKFTIFQGEGGCGKTVLVNLLTHILGANRVFPLNIQAIQHPYELSSLDQQSLFTVSEAVSTIFSKPACAEFIKMAVGDDSFQTNVKYENRKVKHVGRFGFIIVSNHNFRFEFEGRGDEYRDRMILFRFEQHFSENNRDLTLLDKFTGEDWSAVLNWLLEGARRVRRNNWQIKLSPAQISRRDRLIDASKGIELFVRNHVVLSAGHSFTTAEAYRAYLRLEQEEGFEELEEPTFQKRLAKAMHATYNAISTNTLNKGKVRGYSGFKLA